LFGKFLFQGLSHKTGANQVLPESIVQILTQPAPFTIRNLHNLSIQPLSLSHLTFQLVRTLVNTAIEFTNKRGQFGKNASEDYESGESHSEVPPPLKRSAPRNV